MCESNKTIIINKTIINRINKNKTVYYYYKQGWPGHFTSTYSIFK